MPFAISCLVGLLAGHLLSLPIQAQFLTVAQADSLRFFLRTSQADTNRVGALLGLSAYHLHRTLNYTHNLDTALTLVGQAHTLSQQLKYDKGQQEAIVQQGRIFIKQEKLDNVKRMLPGVSSILRIRLLLELGKNKLNPTNSQEAHLDSALWYFSQAKGISNRLGSQPWLEESQILAGVTYLFKGDCKLSQASFMRVIQARQRAGDRAGELQAWLRWAVTLGPEYKCYDVFNTLNRALVLAAQLGDRPREAFLWLILGFIHSNEGNQKQTDGEIAKALTIQKAIGYPAFNRAFHALLEENNYLQQVYLFNMLNVKNALADSAVKANNMSKLVYYNLEIIKDLELSGLREDLDWAYFWLGNTYYDLGQYARGVAYFQQSLTVSHRKGQMVVYAGMIRRMTESLIREGKTHEALHFLMNYTCQYPPLDSEFKLSIALAFGKCYSALNQYKLAEQNYLEANLLSKKTPFGKPLTWLHVCGFYVATAHYLKAATYLKLLAGVKPLDMGPLQRQQLYLMRFKVDSARANYPAALRHYQRYTALKDSLLNETTSQQMAELDVKYQTNQKEQTLKLRQKDITLLSQQNTSQQTQRNAFIGGTLLLAALLGISVNRYRLKQRSNQLLQTQQQQIHYKNQALQQLLDEKELLLREIHHRVKNNLQIVMSLLNSQAASLHDTTALSAIRQSQHRVQAMALIHQKLYQSEGISRIPMKTYIQELASYLHESYELAQPVHFDLQVAPIELDVTQAVPLGLIINEAITNALKYAFPAGQEGCVQVKLGELSEGGYELMIADDGVGLPADFDPAQRRSLGLTLMYGFSEQLGGQLELSRQAGLSIQLRFRNEAYPVIS